MRRSLKLGLLLLLASPALAQQAPKIQLQSTLQNLQESKANEAKLQEQLATTQADLKTMRARATDLAASLQASEENADKAEADLAKLNAQLSVTEQEFKAREAEYAHTVASLLRLKSLPPTALFADQESASTMVRTSRVMQNTNEALAVRAKALKKESERLTALKKQVGDHKAEVTRQQALLSEKQKQLASDVSTRQRLQEKLERDHHLAREQVDKLSRDSASLQELIGKLERSPQITRKGDTVPSATVGEARGRAQLPVVGALLHAFGERKNANETYRGIELAARPGATVVAPYGGQVVFTGPFMNYGRMVLLKHGNGFISLLAGMADISVGLNQSVNKGEPIGVMEGQNPSLYVELREHSKPIDPSTWFAKLPAR